MYFLSRALSVLLFGLVEPFVQICRGHHKKHFCEIVMNWDKWFESGYHFKVFLSRALAGPLFG